MKVETCRKEHFESFARGLSLLRQALAGGGAEALSPLEKEGAIR